MQTLSRMYHHCDYIPTCDLYARESETLVLDGRNVVYLDDNHIVKSGADLAESRIESAILQALEQCR